jgi:hypothetical protein
MSKMHFIRLSWVDWPKKFIFSFIYFFSFLSCSPSCHVLRRLFFDVY